MPEQTDTHIEKESPLMGNRFDEAAKTWDDNPSRKAMAAAVFNAIAERVQLTQDMTVMDFGCGTGNLALAMAPVVGQVQGLDSSREMIGVLREKIEHFGVRNVLAEYSESPIANQPAFAPFDLIVASMVTHHVQDLDALFNAFANWSRPGTILAIADLAPEDGSFHQSDGTIFHMGFDETTMTNLLTDHGFAPTSHDIIHTISREVDSQTKDFPIFLNVSKRKDH